ncbi:hypothetical protein DV515_00012509, partial [Chloebia gouldiae]
MLEFVQELHPFFFKDSFPLATPPAVDCKWLLVFAVTSPLCGAAPQMNPCAFSGCEEKSIL